jgi:5-(carboxyamino)imidazole ribonucleotide mutase
MKVAVIMGSINDLEVMKEALEALEALGIPYEARVVSAHRTPDFMAEFAKRA